MLGKAKSNASYEAAIPLILENVSLVYDNWPSFSFWIKVMIEYVKSAFIDFSAESLMVPWIYICYNHEFAEVDKHNLRGGSVSQGAYNAGASGIDASATVDKSKK